MLFVNRQLPPDRLMDWGKSNFHCLVKITLIVDCLHKYCLFANCKIEMNMMCSAKIELERLVNSQLADLLVISS